jgi:hypothetical protein
MPSFHLVPTLPLTNVALESVADGLGRNGLQTTGYVVRVSRHSSFAPELERWSASRPKTTFIARARLFDGSLVADAALEGRLYQWSWGQVPPGAPPPPFEWTASPSNYNRVTFDDRHAGLWLMTCWRSSHGAASLPIEVIVT